jgi:regulator of protease activity HflC (stomatin/prohibitin superfamily)
LDSDFENIQQSEGFFMLYIALIAIIFFLGVRIIRPTHRGLIETFGKYTKFANSGFHWIIPVIQKIYQVNIT